MPILVAYRLHEVAILQALVSEWSRDREMFVSAHRGTRRNLPHRPSRIDRRSIQNSAVRLFPFTSQIIANVQNKKGHNPSTRFYSESSRFPFYPFITCS